MADEQTVDAATVSGPGFSPGAVRPFRASDIVSNRFRVVREVAEGGMGIVYEVIDEKLGERRALKCGKAGFRSHLPPEARHALKITHRNVCRVFEIHSTHTSQGLLDFLTMEYLDGGTLSDELRGTGGLPPAEALEIAQQICAGVEAAHAQGVLHRDLKSRNVLLTQDKQGRRRAVVTDFGLAEEPSASADTRQNEVAGTPAYFAPERARGVPATVASDIFALGVILHELICGRLPDVGSSGEKVLGPIVSKRWRKVISRCLDPRPDRRYASASDVAAALAAKPARGRVVAAAAALVALLAIGFWQVFLAAPLSARLAILPLEAVGVLAVNADAQTATFVSGISQDLSTRVTRWRPRPPQLVVIPLQEASDQGVHDVDQARERLGASHVLRGTVSRRGDRLILRSAIVDTVTKVPVRELSAEYGTDDAGAVAAALSGLVAAAFRLPRQTAGESVSAAAYPAYIEGQAFLQVGASAYADAIAAFERAVTLDPQSVLARTALVEACYLGWAATGDPKWLARGRQELAKAEQLNADSLWVRIAAGRLNLVPGSHGRAVSEYVRAIELDPASGEGWHGLARAYAEMGDRDSDAAAAFLKAIEVQPGYYKPLIDFGDFQRTKGNYAEAERLWRQVVEIAPQLVAGRINLGALYGDMGRYEEAERELTRAQQIVPASRAILNNLGSLYQYMGRDTDAVTFLEKARAIGPETDVLMLNLGDSYRRLGRTADAEAAYRRGRELSEPILLSHPRDAVRRSYVAYFSLRLGDIAASERELVQALNFDGANRTVIRRAAICFEALGRRDRALAVLESAPPAVLRELNRQPDLVGLREDPRFARLLSAANP